MLVVIDNFYSAISSLFVFSFKIYCIVSINFSYKAFLNYCTMIFNLLFNFEEHKKKDLTAVHAIKRTIVLISLDDV